MAQPPHEFNSYPLKEQNPLFFSTRVWQVTPNLGNCFSFLPDTVALAFMVLFLRNYMGRKNVVIFVVRLFTRQQNGPKTLCTIPFARNMRWDLRNIRRPLYSRTFKLEDGAATSLTWWGVYDITLPDTTPVGRRTMGNPVPTGPLTAPRTRGQVPLRQRVQWQVTELAFRGQIRPQRGSWITPYPNWVGLELQLTNRVCKLDEVSR